MIFKNVILYETFMKVKFPGVLNKQHTEFIDILLNKAALISKLIDQ